MTREQNLDGNKVCVLLSGGLDSAVAALLLRKQGREVHGLHLALLPGREDERESASRVARHLEIPLEVIDLASEFDQLVVNPFIRDYLAGRTPNPCVTCNLRIKFGLALEHAIALGAGRLASGHWARTVPHPSGKVLMGRPTDTKKDQSYFLARLAPETLERLVFPLSGLNHSEVRALGEAAGIPGMGRRSSQEVCFASGPKAYHSLVSGSLAFAPRPGNLLDTRGTVIGTHEGIHRFTVGQRRGVRVGGAPARRYVVDIRPDSGEVVVGPREALERRDIQVERVVWHVPMETRDLARCTVQIRHSHAPAQAGVAIEGSEAHVVFEAPQAAAAPGQTAVFRVDGCIVGAGTIARKMRHAA